MKRLITLAMLLVVGTTTQAQETKTNLYVVAIGVSKHEDPKRNAGVECSAKDAVDLAQFYLGQKGKLYENVEAVVLTDEAAVMNKVLPALTWLQRKAKDRDTVLFFYSGHGGLDRQGQYAVNLANSDGLLPSSSLQVEPIRAMLENVPGKRFMIFDSCHSANSTGIGMANQQLKQTNGQGLVTFASSMSNETSHEDAKSLKNGYFTAAFLEALRGKADVNGNGIVTLAEVNMYVADRVSQLTQGKQNTTIASPATLPSNLPLALVPGGLLVTNARAK
jgi:uncharacterized caspase-like protein